MGLCVFRVVTAGMWQFRSHHRDFFPDAGVAVFLE